MEVRIVSMYKVQYELNLWSTNNFYSFVSSFISGTCQLALVSFGDMLGGATIGKPHSQRFRADEESQTWNPNLFILYEKAERKALG